MINTSFFSADASCNEFTWNSDPDGGTPSNSTNSCGASKDPPVPCYPPLLSYEEYPNPPTFDEIRDDVTLGNTRYNCTKSTGESCLKVKFVGNQMFSNMNVPWEYENFHIVIFFIL